MNQMKGSPSCIHKTCVAAYMSKSGVKKRENYLYLIQVYTHFILTEESDVFRFSYAPESVSTLQNQNVPSVIQKSPGVLP